MTNAQQVGVPEEEALVVEEEIQRNTRSIGDGLAVVVVGYSGAGKTTAAKEIQKTLEEKTNTDVPHVDLNSFTEATDIKIRNSDPFIDTAFEQYDIIPDDKIGVIDGALSFDEIERIANYYGEINIVYIKSHHAARHTRLIDDAIKKDRENKDKFSRDGLRTQDEIVANAGLNDIVKARFFDFEIENESIDESKFENYARYVATDLYSEYTYE
jgi:energy-coupling factor transporter ATP-binding protein EcfA2